MTKQNFKQHPLSWIFGLIAIPLLVLSLVFATRSIDFLRYSHPVEGVISKVLVRGTTINKKVLVEAPVTDLRGDYYPVISYSVGDRQFSFRQKVFEPYAPSVGESRSILVSTTDPSNAKTRHFSLFWLVPLVLFLFGAVFGAGACFIHGFEVSDIQEQAFLIERAPRVGSSQITIQENILDRAPEGKRSRYIVAEFSVDGNSYAARSKPLKGDIVLPSSVTIAYSPNDPDACLILDKID
jgi:hypothetical protein